MDTESVRAAAERMRCGEPAYWAGKYGDMDGDTDAVARHVLAEMDETLADEEFFRSLGLEETINTRRYLRLEGRSVDETEEMNLWIMQSNILRNIDKVFFEVFPPGSENFKIENPTRGQVLTALRLFGIPVKRSEQ